MKWMQYQNTAFEIWVKEYWQPVLNVETREEVARGGGDGHHHLLSHPPLLKVPHKHPGKDGHGGRDVKDG